MSQSIPTITEAAPRIRSGELTPVELLEQCFQRIDRFEPSIRAWAFLDRNRAREDAEKLTAELRAGHYRGPLHGIPLGIKDIIDVFDMPTGCGSKLWANSYARQDATCVRRLRNAGAVIMGKTVTTAFASYDPPITRNPWNKDRTPGGSSSGSAAAVATGMCLAALASQTGGSTIRPASYCGVYSLKPTYGAISVHGVMPLAPSLDHIGIMANCVRDLAHVFQVIAGPDPLDPGSTTRTPPAFDPIMDRALSENRTPRICRLRGFFDRNADEDVSRQMERFAATLSREQRILPESNGLIAWDAIPKWHHTIMAVEAASYHAERARRHREDYPPCISKLIHDGLSTPAPEYRTCLHHQEQCIREAHTLFRDYAVQISPATTTAAPHAATTGNPLFNSVWSFLHLPTVSIPVGWTQEGLPLSVQFAADANQEVDAFAAAEWCERLIACERRDIPQ